MSIDVGVASIISGVELQFYVQHFLPLSSFRCARWTRSLRYIKLNEVTIFSRLYVHVKREQKPKKKNEHKVLNSFALIKHWLHEKFDKTLDLWNIFYYKVAIVPFRKSIYEKFKKPIFSLIYWKKFHISFCVISMHVYQANYEDKFGRKNFVERSMITRKRKFNSSTVLVAIEEFIWIKCVLYVSRFYVNLMCVCARERAICLCDKWNPSGVFFYWKNAKRRKEKGFQRSIFNSAWMNDII